MFLNIIIFSKCSIYCMQNRTIITFVSKFINCEKRIVDHIVDVVETKKDIVFSLKKDFMIQNFLN